MKQHLLCTVPLLLLLLAGCKRPEASFTTDRELYKRGETIQVDNLSKNAFSYHWKLSNSLTEFNSEKPAIIATDTGECVITLTAFGRNGGRADSFSRTVRIASGTGELTFYAQNDAALGYTLELNGAMLGSPSQTYATAPPCNAAGTLTTALAEGTYTFIVRGPATPIPDDVKVEPNVCKVIKI